MLLKTLSAHYSSPGRLAKYKRQFERTTRPPGDDPAAFAIELETLARKAFVDVDASAKLEFRTPESESEHNLTNYFIIILLLFLFRTFWKIFLYDNRSNLFQIFEDHNETINNICKSNTQKVNN